MTLAPSRSLIAGRQLSAAVCASCCSPHLCEALLLNVGDFTIFLMSVESTKTSKLEPPLTMHSGMPTRTMVPGTIRTLSSSDIL